MNEKPTLDHPSVAVQTYANSSYENLSQFRMLNILWRLMSNCWRLTCWANNLDTNAKLDESTGNETQKYPSRERTANIQENDRLNMNNMYLEHGNNRNRNRRN